MDKPVDTDKLLAERLAMQEKEALTELTSRFGALLESAFDDFKAEVPTCGKTLSDLIPHAAKAVGRGYANAVEKSSILLASYVPTLHLADLFLAAACVARDGPAWERLVRTAENQVLPGILKHWASRVGAEEVRRIGSELPGHCLQEYSKGDNVGTPRLATYYGRASLSSWLFATAVRLLQELLRQRSRTSQETGDLAERLAVAPAATQPESQLLSQEAGRQGTQYRQRLTQNIKNALAQMPPRRRLAAILHWVHDERPAEIADKMGVSRPRVTEILSEAREQFRQATSTICQEIAEATSRTVAQVQDLMMTDFGQLLDGLSGGGGS